MKLRDYQRAACEAVWDGWRTKPRQLLVMATGCGKTFLGSALVWRRRKTGRCLWLAHRTELIKQAAESLEALGLSVEIERADERASHNPSSSDVVVASVPTLHAGRLATWPRHAFSTIVADECHRSVAPTWIAVLDHFATDHLGRRTRVLGITATADRGDGIALGHVYDEASFRYGLREAIADGWLVPLAPPRTIVCNDLDLRQIKIIAGDLSASELEAQVSQDAVLHQIADPLIREAGDRPTLVFTPGVDSAKGLARVLAGYVGADAVASVDGATESGRRDEIKAAFLRGDIRVLVNCMIYTEGTDLPPVACVAVARPTKSRSLLAQMIGRATRTLPGVVDGLATPEERKAAIAASPKQDALIVDFTGRYEIDLVGPADVLAGEDLGTETRELVREATRADPERPLEDILAEVEERAAESEAGLDAAKRRARVRAVVDYSAHPIELVDFAERIDLVEDVRKAVRGARKRECKRCSGDGCGVCKGTGRVKGVPYRNGEVIGPTPKQVALLERHGIKLPASAHIRQASAAIDLVMSRGLCSAKQATVLRRAGLRTDLTGAEAGAAMTALSESGWAVTADIALRWGV